MALCVVRVSHRLSLRLVCVRWFCRLLALALVEPIVEVASLSGAFEVT